MAKFVIGVDGGTESIRAGVFTAAGEPLAFSSCPYATSFPQPGWAEQNPSDWWQALAVAVSNAVHDAGVSADDIAAICIDTTCCTVVALDKGGQALRPALLWMDMRSANEAKDVAACCDPALQVNGGGAGPVSAEWMIPKSLWLKRHEPRVFDAAVTICEYQDFMNLHLTGRLVACTNNASIRWHYSTSAGWPTSLLRSLGLEGLMDKWPKEVLPPGALLGPLTAKAAAHLGLRPDTVVAQGGADAFIGMIGLGVLQPGQLALLTGSSHLHLGITDHEFHGPGIWGTYQDAVLSGLHVVEGGQTSTGSIINWLKRLLGPDTTYDDLNEAAAALPPGSEDLICLDHFQGNRTPFTDPLSRGVIAGLTLRHGRAHVFRALLEAVCYGTELVLDAMRTRGFAPSSMAVAGGSTRSQLWMQIHADVSNIPLHLTKVADAPSLGCAILATVAAGIYPDIPTAASAMVQVDRVVYPQPEQHKLYSRHLEKYRALYQALAPIFHGKAAAGGLEAVNGSTAAHDHEAQPVPPRPPAPPPTPAPPPISPTPDGAAAAPPPSPGLFLPAILSPSILAADFSCLAAEVALIVEAGADWVHVDVFDGSYVDNFTVGPPVVASLHKRCPNAFLDCHLALNDPGRYVSRMAAAGASRFTFHVEVMADAEAAVRLAEEVRGAGMLVGLALAPSTPTQAVAALLERGLFDLVRGLVLCMTVPPGFGGQAFMPEVMPKVTELRRLFPTLNIQVDGGINAETALVAARAGANVMVAGSAVFKAKEGVDVAVTAIKAATSHGMAMYTAGQ